MIIKVPKEIKVSSHAYQIVFKPNLKIDDGFQGTVQHRTQVIEIEPLTSLDFLLVTLLHEIIHIISTVYSLHLEEDAVDRLAEGLAQGLLESFGLELDWSDIKGELKQ